MGLCAHQLCTSFVFVVVVLHKNLFFDCMFQFRIVFTRPMVLAIKYKANFYLMTYGK